MVEYCMGLNIKNPRVEANIRKLAKLTGTSLTEAVAAAIDAQLKTVEPDKAAPTAAQDRAWWASFRSRHGLPRPGDTSACDDLYDEDGAPR
jgi:antitoxin VapB